MLPGRAGRVKQNYSIKKKKKSRAIFRKSIFAFSKSNRKSPILEDGFGWDVIKCVSHQVAAPSPPVQEVALLLPTPLAPATVAETLGQL